MPTNFDIRVKLSPPPPSEVVGFGGVLLSIEVLSSSGGIGKEVFVFERPVQNFFSSDGSADETFYSVATPAQLETFPVVAAAGPQGLESAFFRKPEVHLVFDDIKRAAEVRDMILGDLSKLAKGFDLMSDEAAMEVTDYTVDGGGFAEK